MLPPLPVREEVKDPENLEHLKKKVSELLDFDCSKYTDSFLGRRFYVSLRKHNINSYAEYMQILIRDKSEWEALKTELTIHVTHLFRDKDFWDYFKDDVINMMIADKDQKKENTIDIWSAGCSSGEEPVSIAISLLEKLGPKIGKYRISIVGTDYDHEIVKKAMNAAYEEQQFRETDGKIKEKYFIKNPEGTYTPTPQVRALIRFKQEDMLSMMLKNVDVIFCRNVVIYFERDAKRQLYNKFFEALNPGGFLILGKTEYLDGEAREKLKITNMKERVYRKPE